MKRIRRALARCLAPILFVVGLMLGVVGVASVSTAGAVNTPATSSECYGSTGWTVTAAGVCFNAAAEEVFLPSGHVYSTNPATVLPGFSATAFGLTPTGIDFTVGYDAYGPVRINYTPFTGAGLAQCHMVIQWGRGHLVCS